MPKDFSYQKAKLERDFQNLKSRANDYYDRWYESTLRQNGEREDVPEKRDEHTGNQLNC
jgi:hypothetical protein